MRKTDNILIIAGEVSGDSHAADLADEYKKFDSAVEFWGIGGDQLKSQGAQLLFHLEEMSFFGVSEVFRHLPFIFQVRREILAEAEKRKPVCAVLVDYPGFNLRIAVNLKKMGIPVVYYISPKLWAWGGWRVNKIRKYVDKLLVLFAFEVDFYKQFGIKADFVGHPLVDRFKEVLPQDFKPFDEKEAVLGLLPGSRRQEVSGLLPDMVKSADILYRENRIDSAEIVKVEHLPLELYASIVGQRDYIKIVQQPLQHCLSRYDAALIASGTATLETGYWGVPMVIVYRVQAITYWLAKLFVRIKDVGLINIVAGKRVVPELIQKDFTVEKAAELLRVYLTSEGNIRKREELKKVRKRLGDGGVSLRAAEYLREFVLKITE
jgi:lipid-A-disaccharide synthase